MTGLIQRVLQLNSSSDSHLERVVYFLDAFSLFVIRKRFIFKNNVSLNHCAGHFGQTHCKMREDSAVFAVYLILNSLTPRTLVWFVRLSTIYLFYP